MAHICVIREYDMHCHKIQMIIYMSNSTFNFLAGQQKMTENQSIKWSGKTARLSPPGNQCHVNI